MIEAVRLKVEEYLNNEITKTTAISGGCISSAWQIETGKGSYFLKYSTTIRPGMFRAEVNGLNELAVADCIHVPKVYMAEDDFILMELIEEGRPANNFFEDFGRKFARLHQHTADRPGFYQDNFIGSTEQMNKNEETLNWVEFYWQKRLLLQLLLAEKKGLADKNMSSLFSQLEGKVETILESDEKGTSLLHGDLWSGNYLVNKSGEVVLIDPAVYYGHREADLAMTKLFGGFDAEFYRSYQEEYPLEDGFRERENLYKLYHVMNHLNLFGSSYFGQAMNILKQYV